MTCARRWRRSRSLSCCAKAGTASGPMLDTWPTPGRCFLPWPGHRSSPSVCIGASGATPRSAISSAIVKASTWAILLFVVIGLAVDRMTEVPRGVWVNQWLILIVLLCGTRLAYRFAKSTARRARAGALRPPITRDVPVLLYGCGPMASLFVGAVQSTPATNMRVVGIIDDSGIPRGRYVHDVPVLGAPKDLDRIIADLAVQGIQPQRLVMTRPADGLSPEVRTFTEHCRARYGLELHFLPDMLGVPAGAAACDAATAASSCERGLLPRPPPGRGEREPSGPAPAHAAARAHRARRARRPGPPDSVPPVAARPRHAPVHALQVPHHARSLRPPRHGAPGRRTDLAGRPHAAAHAARRAAAAVQRRAGRHVVHRPASAAGRATCRTGSPSASRSAPASPAGPRCTAANG